MAILSAGIKVNEFDFSEYAVQLGRTQFCVVGGATKGDLNTPITAANLEELIAQVGYPLTDDYGIQAAVRFLKQGNQVTYLRVGDGNEDTSDVDIPGTASGTPAVESEGDVSFTGSTNPSDGDTVTFHDTVPWLNVENDADGAVGNVGIWTSAPARIAVVGMAGGDVSNPAVGTLKLIGSAMPLDGDTIIIGDGSSWGIFVFDENWPTGPTGPSGPTGPTGPTNATGPTGWTGDTTRVNISGVTNPYEAMALLHAAINAHAFNVSSVNYADTKKYIFEFDDNASYTVGNLPVLIGATAAASLTNLVSAFNGSAVDMTAVDGTISVPQMDVTHDTGGIDGNATISETGANIGANGMTGGVDEIAGGVETLFTVLASSPGSWGDDIDVVISDTTLTGAPAANFDILVYAPVDESGVLQVVERFVNCSLDPTSARYVEKIIEEGIKGEVALSEYIEVEVIKNGDPTNDTYDVGASTSGADGYSALTSTDYIGTVSGVTATGLQALRNAEKIEFNVVAVPGVVHKDVIDELIAVAEARADCLALVDPPLGLSRDEVIDWHNGISAYPDAPTAQLDSSYATLNWSWMRVYDDYNAQNIWLPPSGFVAARFAYTDNVSHPWFPAAGENRGVIDADEVEYSPSKDDRDLLCPIMVGENRVNPVVDFASGGPTLYGNRTLQRAWSQLTDVHVRRLLLHAEKLCATAVRYLVFEPSDPNTWKKFEKLCNKELGEIAAARGLETFKVRCDETTNTTVLRQQRRMKGKLYVVPQGAAEGIELDFSIFASGAEFSET